MREIILNADVGEEAGFDKEIMPYISWCNIACGSHAGNEKIIQKTIQMAIDHDVKIGAHPSYPDQENFGRAKMNMPHKDLVKTITEQIQLVKFYTEKAGAKLHHVKPHGALYNTAVVDEKVACSIIESVKNVDRSLILITSCNSKLSYLSDKDLEVKHEVFADRNYNKDLTLVSRLENDAVLTNPRTVFQHVLKMVSEGKVVTREEEELPIFFDTICVHGDNPKSVHILKYLYTEFLSLGLM
ncbi:5-oxoprolinase subunit PxpA [Aquimarina longa]|uniref:5-oxoprolinase subunit PxpA n=1 Tax=Aquimarina longa TaxID=1080221 RepID=UPI0007814B64|nr:5-oxoprolinase subunit PxpA [Aquimarina longa]